MKNVLTFSLLLLLLACLLVTWGVAEVCSCENVVILVQVTGVVGVATQQTVSVGSLGETGSDEHDDCRVRL